jgi:predicted HD phosphohydrolase
VDEVGTAQSPRATESPGGPAPATSVDDIVQVLRASTAYDLSVGSGPRHDLLDHSLQTAQVLAERYPDDVELQLAGLVHDIGHMLPPRRDEVHGTVAAVFVAPVLGDRIADLVRLHVPAKRYLVTTDADYEAELAGDSIISMERQGGPMSAAEVRDFEGEPRYADALVLRRADEAGKVPGRPVPGLDTWLPALQAHNWAGRGDTAGS